MHDELNDITTRIQELYDEKNNLGLTVIADLRSKDKNRKNQGPLPPGAIVGREGEKEILVQQLLADHEPCDQNNFRVVPIVGMGGLGKTTLARLLYNEPKVKQHFELKAWVCIPDEFDSFKICQRIFESVTKEVKKFDNPSVLQEALEGQLSGKRFLLVLDDVWTEKIEDWETLVPPFRAVAPGSKIIITTRKTTLIQHLKYGNPYSNPFPLNKLSDDDSLSLFARYANNFDSNPTLRPHGEAIVKKCDGLPLALKALGRSLSTKTNEDEWKDVLESDIWGLKDADGVLPALRLSYLELSPCLKLLFAYTCLFPKDYVFEKEDLIWLWMAEGFLHETTKKSMERLGEEYFDELLSRSFFEDVHNDKSLFVMHDLMNDLATSVAGEFFVRLDIEMKNEIDEHSLKKFRHMSFVRETYMTCKRFNAFERANRLRTFLAVPVVVGDQWEKFHLSNKILVDLLPHLPMLRVLSLSKIEIDEVPESVGKLKHLRYLNLSQTPITRLPENVCNLYNLQTLIVFGCRKLSELPKSFSKLKNLRHFDIRDTPLLENMPLGIGELKSLQTLSKIVIGRENEFGISRLKNLKNLRQSLSIHGLDKLQNVDEAREALSQMSLRELKAEWSDVSDGSAEQTLAKEVLDVLKPRTDNLKNLKIISYGGTEFPEWVVNSLFIRLTDVSIDNCRNCVCMPPLGQLPSLKKLSIASMNGVKKVGPELLGTGPAAFPSLENLGFRNMEGCEVWSTEITGFVDGVFPCLKELDISNCPNMARWEVWSANADVGVFPYLEELSIYYCPKLVKVSLEALPSLRVLRIDECGEGVLKSLVGVASSVTTLIIKGISGLSDEVWGGVVQYLGAVEWLSILKCNEIRNLWESELVASKEVLVNLKTLRISDCNNLERIGGGEKDEEEGSNLPTSLRMLSIWDCNNLKHLSCSNNIEELSIDRCSSITSVSFPTIERGGWQKLKSLEIEKCSSEVLGKELEKVLIINNTNMLQVLEIRSWESLKSIMKLGCFDQLTRLLIEECGRIESFPDLQNLTSLKHLEITYCPRMDGPPPVPLRSGGSGGVSVGVWPPKLESLEIGQLKRPISEWGPLPTSSLVQLTLWGGLGSSEVPRLIAGPFSTDNVKSFPTSLLPSTSSLRRLELIEFKEMERISEGLQHLTSLRHLYILGCREMKDLPEKLLPSLLSLEIYNCRNEELKEKMMKMSTRGNSYWPLLSHIPKVDIKHL